MFIQDIYKFNDYKDIYLFSNVPYSKSNKLYIPKGTALAIFINKANNIDCYKQCNRIIIRRHDTQCFGRKINGIPDIIMFDKSTNNSGIESLSQCFDKKIFETINKDNFNKAKASGGLTTGYYIAKYILAKCPKVVLHLVNFGQCLKNRYNLPQFHNWSYQDQDLKNVLHIFLD